MIKRKNNSGQLLPVLSVVLIFLIIFIGANGERALLGIEKIRNQRIADSLAMEASTEQARALNTIAAINQGFDKIQRNMMIFVTVGNLLRICMLTIYLAAECKSPWSAFESKVKTFLPKVVKLVNMFKKWQDELIVWAEKTPFRTLQVFNLMDITDYYAFLYPSKPHLKVGRLGDEDLPENLQCKVNRNAIVPANNSDPSHPTDPMGVFRNVHVDHNDFYNMIYRSITTGREKNIQPVTDPYHEGYRRVENGEEFQLSRAYLHVCISTSDLLSQFAKYLPSMPKIPGKIILLPEFNQNQRITIALIEHHGRDLFTNVDMNHLRESQSFVPLIRKGDLLSTDIGFKHLKVEPSWTLSESKVDGPSTDDLKFSPNLVPVTKDQKVHDYAMSKIRVLPLPKNSLFQKVIDIAGNELIYDKKEVSDEIAH